ncbi:hypothetical protein GOODEAATRI_002745 [Goodea atripinnis]|uniref:Secreted protein n=1 Tax=Goodea atripinnis TaxID=208336 RepID=A0ABV0PKG8_9TELE
MCILVCFPFGCICLFPPSLLCSVLLPQLLHISSDCSAFSLSQLQLVPLISSSDLPVISPAPPQCMCTHQFSETDLLCSTLDVFMFPVAPASLPTFCKFSLFFLLKSSHPY